MTCVQGALLAGVAAIAITFQATASPAVSDSHTRPAQTSQVQYAAACGKYDTSPACRGSTSWYKKQKSSKSTKPAKSKTSEDKK